jgi:nucleotide-binding universal stress UspA family protein
MTQPEARIVVGVDGSAASMDALRWASRQAALTGAAVEAVISWQYPVVARGYPMSVDVDWQSNARTALDAAVDEILGAEAASVARNVVEGHPAQVLLEAATGADLLVVGGRGHGGFAGMILGSVSAHVVAHASCPVLVVRHNAQR